MNIFAAKTAKGLEPPASKVEKKPAAPMANRSSKGSRNEPSQAPVTSKPKDPLKVVGSKQNIKLTLLNKVTDRSIYLSYLNIYQWIKLF
jgi:hypothetical protein